MNIAYGQILGIVSEIPLGEDHENILFLVRESGDNRTKSEYISVLNVLNELERVGVVRSETTDLHTKWYTPTGEA